MRAMVVRGQQLSVEEVSQPTPGPLQVLARVCACGICGSDLHAVQYAEQRASPLDGVVMGHEFVAEIVATGPGAEAWPSGTRVVSSPTIPDLQAFPALSERDGPSSQPAAINYFLSGHTQTIGYSAQFPGGFGEYVVMSAPLLVPVPDHVPDRVAATVEPCAVGLHAVRAARLQPHDHALVMGAGPIGLMTLLWLKREGVRHVTVSEPTGPRRMLAAQVGADLVLDPAVDNVTARVVEAAGGPPPLVFDCVGVEGTLQQAMDLAAPQGRVVVVGVCSTDDRVRPRVGIAKHLTVQFVLAYTAAEVADALSAIADGSIDTDPLVTRTVTLDELPTAFYALSKPQECKVIVEFPR